MNPLDRIREIAGITFLEAVRQKFVSALVLMALLMVAGSRFLKAFNFGTGELKFIVDFGFGALFVFGAVLAVAVTTQLFFSEIENRTALTLLAKPVRRIEFLAGKWSGVAVLLALFAVLVTGMLLILLYAAERSLVESLGDGFAEADRIRYADLWVFALCQWLKCCVLASITLFIASFSNTNLYTLMVAFLVFVICQLQYIAAETYVDVASLPLRAAVFLLALVFPNFQLFNIGDQLGFIGSDPLPLATLVGLAGYAAAYIAVFLTLAEWSFRNREV